MSELSRSETQFGLELTAQKPIQIEHVKHSIASDSETMTVSCISEREEESADDDKEEFYDAPDTLKWEIESSLITQVPNERKSNDDVMDTKVSSNSDQEGEHPNTHTKTINSLLNSRENHVLDEAAQSDFSPSIPLKNKAFSRDQATQDSNESDTTSNISSRTLNSKISDQCVPQLDICNEIDPGETDSIIIQFNTLILKEYWKKVDAICLRIGHTYFNDFQKSVVQFSEVSSIKIKSGKFVIIKGKLKFPTRYIDKEQIYFPYKYYLYSKDGYQSYEHLHLANINFDRFFRWNMVTKPIGTLMDSTYQHYDMMIIPDISKIEGRSFWDTAINFVTPSAWYKKVSFSNVIDRILVSLQVLLPNYLGCGESQPCNCMGEFLKQFDTLVNSLFYFLIKDPSQSYSRYWEHYHWVQFNLTIVIETWISANYSPAKISHFNPRSIVHKFYLACYLIKKYNINNDEVILKLVDFVEESIAPMLQNKSYVFDEKVCTDVAFGNIIRNSVQEFIFNRITGRYPAIFLVLVPLYHVTNNLQEYCNQLHEGCKFEQNEYWGFPNKHTLCWDDA